MMQHRLTRTLSRSIICACAGACTALALCAFPAFPFAAPSQAYADPAAQSAEEVLASLNAMQATLDETSNAYIAALTEYQQAVDAQNAAQKRINEITDEIGGIQDRLGDRARDMYRNGSASLLDLLLGSASFKELTQNWEMLSRMNENDAAMSAQARELREEAEAQKREYAAQAEVADKKAKEASEQFEHAKEAVEQLQATYDSMSAEAQQLYAAQQGAEYVTEGGVVNDDGTVTDIQTGEVYSSPVEYHAATGNAIVDRARAMIGSDYVWGGVGGGDGGFDCSGLVSYAITGSNTRIGTSYTIGDMYTRVSDPQAGDLYVTDGHIAIYTGEGTLVHAVDYGIGVAETTFREKDGGFFVRPE